MSVGDLFSDRSSHFTNLEALSTYWISVDSVFYVHGHEGGNSFSDGEKAEKQPLQKLPLEPFRDVSWYFEPTSSSLQSSPYFLSLCQQYLRKQQKEQFVFSSQFERFPFMTILALDHDGEYQWPQSAQGCSLHGGQENKRARNVGRGHLFIPGCSAPK